jgi:uncharacterized protein
VNFIKPAARGPRGVSLATWLALPIALIGPPLIAAVAKTSQAYSFNIGREIVLQAAYCGLAAAVLWIILKQERAGLESIGLRRPTLSTVLFAAAIYAAGLLLRLVTTPLLQHVDSVDVATGMQTLAIAPGWFRIVLALAGGAIEELLYRGYAIERLAAITGNRWFGAAVATAVFAVAHIPLWGIGYALAADLPFGILMAAAYLWKRDLAANIIAHSGGLLTAMFTVVP